MRLSLKRAAHAFLSRAVYRKFGASRSFFARCGIPRVFPSNLLRSPQLRPGAPRSHQRRPDFRLRSTGHATTHAAFSQRKPHEVAQRHQTRQEIRDTWAENDGRSPTTAFLTPPLSSRPKCRWACGQPKKTKMAPDSKSGSCSLILDRAKRSGGTRVRSSQTLAAVQNQPPLCHLDRSVPGFPT
jgi:hypothetical protein